MKSQSVNSASRVLFVTHYYPPETNAPACRVSELAREWSLKGRHVEIVTGMPNHPNGIIPQEYRGAWYRREDTDGVTVHRGRIYPAPNRGHVKRILNYLSFMVSAVVTGAAKGGPADCVVATSPQLFCAVAGWILSLLKRAPFVFEVRDVWPAEIVAVEAIRNRVLIRALEFVEEFLYRRAARIVAVAQGTVDILTTRGVPPGKLTVLPNGVDTEAFLPGPKHNWVRRMYNLDGECLISYVGTVGMAHRLSVVLDAADILKQNPRIRFLIVGDGAERDHLEAETRRRGLHNVMWVPSQPRNRVAAFYQASDACLVHLRKADLFTKNVPSKMYEIMSSGRPMLLGTRGESQHLGQEAGCAIAFEPESADDLAKAITELNRSPRLRQELGSSGRRFVLARFDRRILAEQYLRLLDGVCSH